MGVVTAGGAIGQVITPSMVQPMIVAFGWRNTRIILGAGFLLVLVSTRRMARHQVAAGRNPDSAHAGRAEELASSSRW